MIRDILMGSETLEYTIEDRLSQLDCSSMNHEELGCNNNTWKEFRFLTQLKHTFSNIIAYPSNIGEEENYSWFMENKKIKGTGTNPIIEEYLPYVKKPELPRYQKISTNKRSK